MATQITATAQHPVQIDYQLRQVQAPRYKMMKIPLNNLPAASATIYPTTGAMLEWKLPTRVYNLARSYISYNVDIPPTAGIFNYSFEDVFDLGQTISFGSAGGMDLVNLQYAQNYTKLARKIATSIDDFIGNDDMSGLYKANTTGGSLPVAGNVNNLVPGGYNSAASYASSDNYLENRYCATTAAVNTVFDRYRQYPLSAFVGTLLGVDRDFFSPVEQYLRVLTNQGEKMTFGSSSSTNPSTGVVAPGNISINNVYLYLAIEQNQGIVDSMIAKYQSGQLVYRIPYTTAFKNVGGPANAQTNIQIQLSPQYGQRLKRILHSVWHDQERLNTAYDSANWNGEKVLNYQTFLDSIPIQDRILSCLRPAGLLYNSDDWLENKKFLDRRSMILSKEHYAINWFHIDQFFEPHDKDGSLPEVNLDEGIRMDTSKQWLFSATAGARPSLIHYTYAEFARDIAITPAGPVFV